MTDYQLYKLLSDIFKDIRSGISPSDATFESIKSQADSRNPKIVNQALIDSFAEKSVSLGYEFMNSEEISKLLPSSIIENTLQPLASYEDNFYDHFGILPSTIRYLKIVGNSMKGLGIDDGDTVMYQLGAEIISGNIYIFKLIDKKNKVQDKSWIKQIIIEDERMVLRSANKDFDDVLIDSLDKILIIGEVIYTMKKFK